MSGSSDEEVKGNRASFLKNAHHGSCVEECDDHEDHCDQEDDVSGNILVGHLGATQVDT